jgi:transposase InsO family protein
MTNKINCYSYPEAIPLKNQEAETVADALISMFSRVGVPKELLTDQGSKICPSLMVLFVHNS